MFALDRGAVLQLLERDVVHGRVDPHVIEDYRAYFSEYLFQRFSVSNDGVACSHPAQLGRFFWDEPPAACWRSRSSTAAASCRSSPSARWSRMICRCPTSWSVT